MTRKRLELTRRKILGAAGAVGIAGAGVGAGTSALFSDEEAFTDNAIRAGTTNLVVEAAVVEVSEGLAANGTVEIVDATDDGDGDDDQLTVDGTPAPALGLTVGDAKPGDSFVLRVTVDVEDNPMYVAAVLPGGDAVDDSENRPNPEPEAATQAAGTNPDVQNDDPNSGAGNGSDPIGDGSGDDAGDLDNRLLVTLGYDSDRTSRHDDGLEGSIVPESGFDGTPSATATAFLAALDGGYVYRGQEGASGSPPGGHADSGPPTRIGDPTGSNVDRGKVTHFIEFELPLGVGNEVMGDSVSFDLAFQAEQVRNNDDPFGAAGGQSVVIPDQTANAPP
ncbi:SipW-dependent-type signal peptide-containing protein [Natronomonas marina]|uniref:SipW-dependent-type signal peptide-containing protein n=1 Tax=Natronomonas marina TaxID=2961939 RepID=UPI0020C9AF8F|nr:SipW-dependent-type signal peptide-containing protein [Natronomonas marina]